MYTISVSCFTVCILIWEVLGKMPHKENSRENSCPRAGFNGRYEVVLKKKGQKGRGSGQAWPFIGEGG
jgi:hypothetical protein